MKITKIFLFLILIVMFSYSCKKKKAVSPIILEKYNLQVMLHLYPEDGVSGGSVSGSATGGTEETPIVELTISGTGVETIYTETNLSPGTPIIVENGQTISLRIKARNDSDTVYLGGYVIDDIQEHSPTSNGAYTYTFTALEDKLLVIGVSKDNNDNAVQYKAFQLYNSGRGQSQMYVYTNDNDQMTGETEKALISYRVPSKLIATITLPEATLNGNGYTLGLKSIADASYSLKAWFPMDGIKDPDTDGVIYPVTQSIKNSTLAYVKGGNAEENTIFNPLLLKAVFSEFQTWDGTTKEEPMRKGRNYYVISLASHLAWVANQVEISDGGFQGYIFELQDDIDFYRKDFKGIATGTRGKIFQGAFNGNGKSIKNARFIFDTSANFDNNGFIGKLGVNGSISNITIDSTVNIESIGGNSLGAVVGRNYGSVVNCTNLANIDASGVSLTAYYVGGVVGYNDGGTIKFVHNMGTISNALHSVGGVVGYNKGTLSYAYNDGTVTAKHDVGGVVGIAGKAISEVYNDGVVSNAEASMTVPNGERTGGVVGSIAESGAQITHVYNTGLVIGGDYSGGILGYSISSSITLDECYNIGTIYGITNKTGGIIGGISKDTTILDGALKELYFLKDNIYNASLKDGGIGAIENSYSDTANRSLTGGRFTNILNFNTDIWAPKTASHGLKSVNGVSERYLLKYLLGKVN